ERLAVAGHDYGQYTVGGRSCCGRRVRRGDGAVGTIRLRADLIFLDRRFDFVTPPLPTGERRIAPAAMFAATVSEEHERIGQRPNDRHLLERREDGRRIMCAGVLSVVDQRRWVMVLAGD